MYLDMGIGTTKLMIAHGSQLVFAKTILIGGRHFDETIASQHSANRDWSHRIRLRSEHLTPEARAAAGVSATADFERIPAIDLSEPLDTLTDELAMCRRNHDSIFPDQRINQARFVGGESRHTPLVQHIAKSLRLPSHLADPMSVVSRTGKEKTIGVELSAPQPGWAVPIGLSFSPTDL